MRHIIRHADTIRFREADGGDAAARVALPADGAFIEAVATEGQPEGARWRIRVIRAGLSGNGNFYPDAVLREAAPRFAGARVFVKADAEHLAGGGRDVRNLVGRLAEPRFVEGSGPDAGEVQAVLELIEPDGPIGTKLREAAKRGMSDLIGFSIDAEGRAEAGRIDGRQVKRATAIDRVHSVDLIAVPGAGGRLIGLIEALKTHDEDEDMKLRQRMLKFVEAHAPDTFAKLDADAATDEQVEAAYREAVAAKTAADAKAAEAGAGDTKVKDRGGDADDVVALVEARAYARATIAQSTLPAAAKARLQARFADRAHRFVEADVDRAIKEEREYLAAFVEGGNPRGLGETSRIEAGEQQAEKVAKMLDAFFAGDRQARSFREAYVHITGDTRVTGQTRHVDQARFREAIGSSTFADVLGDSITRRMVADYREGSIYDVWRRLVTTTPIADFRTNERTRWGGYGDLPAVAEGDPYLPLGTPTDEKATYAVSKRGATEQMTLEAIKNDDVGLIRRIPTKLSRSAKRTLAKFALDFIRTNPAIYDGVALFHADHGNLGSAALDKDTLAAGRLAMLKQGEPDSADRLGIGPKYLWVPPDLEEDGVDLFRRNTENDRTFVQSLSLEVMPVWYWTDASDWALSADPMDVPTIEIGFLDGQEEPELFVQDLPTVGSMFSNDQLTWKIRHVYGGNVLDYRGLYKAVVA